MGVSRGTQRLSRVKLSIAMADVLRVGVFVDVLKLGFRPKTGEKCIVRATPMLTDKDEGAQSFRQTAPVR